MIRICKALVIFIATLLILAEQLRNYKEKGTKSAMVLLILACVMLASAIIVVVGFWV